MIRAFSRQTLWFGHMLYELELKSKEMMNVNWVKPTRDSFYFASFS